MHNTNRDEIALCSDESDRCRELFGDRLLLDLEHLGEEPDDALTTGSDVGIVLDVALREQLIGHVPMARLQKIPQDAVDHLLIGVQFRVGAGEQSFLVDRGDDRAAARAMASKRLAELDARMEELQQARASLQKLVSECAVGKTGPCPILKSFGA